MKDKRSELDRKVRKRNCPGKEAETNHKGEREERVCVCACVCVCV